MSSLLDSPSETVPASALPKQPQRAQMKLISCIIRAERLDAVKDALSELGLVGGMTVTDVRGFGRQKGQVEYYRGGEYTIRFIPKVRIDVVVQAEDVETIMSAIAQAARTGQVGDGKIFVIDMRSAMRIRTGEKGTIAL